MLVKFDSDVGSFSMDRDIAVQLLRAMGHSGTVPGAMLPSDIPAALARLKAMAGKSPPSPGQATEPADDDRETPVSMRQRAFPLIELLGRAADKGKEVLWK
ncbi:MAG TPA: DUF1840 domain-containing protein [Burkholderiales bacterium]|jgi:hypothetical protein|nr:DUF1840 domain-containing protein [Burkholderiales bacterium]